MKPRESLTRLINLLVSDAKARQDFFLDPLGTAKRIGVELTDDEAERFKKELAKGGVDDLEERLSKSACLLTSPP
ncbi:MAG: hypothetical protein K6T75_08945 [Acetobacteraceae bacterium]|nr:hypothetical protein [Acetobacteraceae bacterium]